MPKPFDDGISARQRRKVKLERRATPGVKVNTGKEKVTVVKVARFTVTMGQNSTTPRLNESLKSDERGKAPEADTVCFGDQN
ncbi:hypothetical protein Btru_018256 [Bulinus truncatus]|nr:hypothetical protein Btru_018256 [Bulinus truncatus]